LIPLLVKYPQINFYLIIPPFSKYFYQSFYCKNKRNLSEVFVFLLNLVNIGENFKNVKIYGFDDCTFTTNLRNYHDSEHASPEINEYMLYCIEKGKHLLNVKNIDAYIKNFLKTLNDFAEIDLLDNHRDGRRFDTKGFDVVALIFESKPRNWRKEFETEYMKSKYHYRFFDALKLEFAEIEFFNLQN